MKKDSQEINEKVKELKKDIKILNEKIEENKILNEKNNKVFSEKMDELTSMMKQLISS